MRSNWDYLGLILMISLFTWSVYYWIKKNKEEKALKVKKSEELEKRKRLYQDLRAKAFKMNPKKLDYEPNENESVFGLITELGMNNGVCSVIAFATGDLSMYVSSGGGFIGAGQHEEVSSEVKQIIEKVHHFKKDATLTENFSFPVKNQVNFYFLTTTGNYIIQAKHNKLINGSSEHSDLFNYVDRLICLIREKSNTYPI